MKRESLFNQLDRAFRKALMQLRETEGQASVVDLYLFPNPEGGEFTMFDDEDRLLIKASIPVWQENYETLDAETELHECESILREILHKANEEGLFETIDIIKPFSILMVDEEMQTLAELLLLDDEQLLMDDHFLQNMDKELDEFFEKLMSDI